MAPPPPDRPESRASSRYDTVATQEHAVLDARLAVDADSAMAAFRQAFDAVVAENSLTAREALRRAAPDLMRVGSRTTVALERLDAQNRGQLPFPSPAHARRSGR